MKDWGCLVTDVAIALKLTGHNVDPGILVDGLNSIGGFTPAGAMYWGKVTQLYPNFKYGSGDWRFEEGWFGNIKHWVLKTPNGTVYEPYYNNIGYPAGFRKTGQVRLVTIAGTVQPAPPPSGSYQFNVDLSLGSRHPDVQRLQDKLKSLGFFPRTVASTGYFGTVTRDSVSKFQKAYNISPAAGFFGPITRSRINKL